MDVRNNYSRYNETSQVASARIDIDSVGVVLDEKWGTWYVLDKSAWNGKKVFLLENEQVGDDMEAVIVSEDGEMILDGVWNGFDDLGEM